MCKVSAIVAGHSYPVPEGMSLARGITIKTDGKEVSVLEVSYE